MEWFPLYEFSSCFKIDINHRPIINGNGHTLIINIISVYLLANGSMHLHNLILEDHHFPITMHKRCSSEPLVLLVLWYSKQTHRWQKWLFVAEPKENSRKPFFIVTRLLLFPPEILVTVVHYHTSSNPSAWQCERISDLFLVGGVCLLLCLS